MTTSFAPCWASRASTWCRGSRSSPSSIPRCRAEPKGNAMLKGILTAAFLAGGLTGLALTTSLAAAEDVMVKIDNFTFGPQKLTVKAGTTITWVNQDDIPHTVVATTLAFRSK